jgi:DNA-binding transcriptional regulator PaaX
MFLKKLENFIIYVSLCNSRIYVITLYSGHVCVYYASMLRCWHLVRILVRTDHPCLGVGCHRVCLWLTSPSVLDSVYGCFYLHPDVVSPLALTFACAEGLESQKRIKAQCWTVETSARAHAALCPASIFLHLSVVD